MSSLYSLEVKKFFFNNLSDIIIALLFLVAILFLVFSIMHLLRKRKNLIDDTVPYLVHLKETLDELIKEADELKKELTQAKLSTTGVAAGAAAGASASNTEELSGLQTLVDEKSHEITKLKDEIKKYESLEKDRKKSDSKPSVNEAELKSIKEENQKLKAQLEETERQAASGAVAGVDLDKIKSENTKLKDRLGLLETKIAEYEIIEDDLANLKILKEENEKLKGQIEELHSLVGDDSGEHKQAESKPAEKTVEQPKAVQESIIVADNNNDDVQAEIDNVLQKFDNEMQKEVTPAAAAAAPVSSPAPIVAAPEKGVVVEESVDPELLKEFGLDPNDMQAAPAVAASSDKPPVVEKPAEPVVAAEPAAAAVVADAPAPSAVAAPVETPVSNETTEQKTPETGENIEGKLAEEFEKFMAENH